MNKKKIYITIAIGLIVIFMVYWGWKKIFKSNPVQAILKRFEGHVISSPGGTEIYLVEGGKKRKLSHDAMDALMRSRYGNSNWITTPISSQEFNVIPNS